MFADECSAPAVSNSPKQPRSANPSARSFQKHGTQARRSFRGRTHVAHSIRRNARWLLRPTVLSRSLFRSMVWTLSLSKRNWPAPGSRRCVKLRPSRVSITDELAVARKPGQPSNYGRWLSGSPVQDLRFDGWPKVALMAVPVFACRQQGWAQQPNRIAPF